MDTEKIIASVIANQTALHFNEEIKHTAYYKKDLKNRLNLCIKELIKAEEREYDLVDEVHPELLHQISSNQITFTEHIIDRPFTEMAMLQNMIMAYRKNPKRVEGIVNKVLTE